MQPKRFKLLPVLTACALSMGAIAANAAAPATPQGTINFYTFAGDQRAGIQAGTAVPNGSYYPKRAEGPYNGFPGPDSGDDDTKPAGDFLSNYNMVLKGYFYPPKTGKLQLAIATDDPGQLYFSTDDSPANKRQVASESQWNPVRAFGGAWDGSTALRRNVTSTGADPIPRPENWSAYIDVVKGKPYYIEGVGTEFGGGDNLAIAFRYDTDPEFADDDKPISGQYLSPISMPAVPSILGQPQDVAGYLGGIASFSVAIDIPPTVTLTSIQWTKNGVAVPDSDKVLISFTTTAADDGAKFQATIVTSAGTLKSNEATLYVSGFTTAVISGALKWEAYLEINGNLDAFTSDPKYPDSPDDIKLVTLSEGPAGYADNYGMRLTGFVTPQESGDYVFFMTSDDNGAFFLSTDDKPANKKQIAAETAWSNAREWTVSGGSSDLSSKRSDEFPGSEWPTGATISLVANKRYYIEALGKEGGGGDNLGFTMVKKGTTPTNGGSILTGNLIAANAPSKGDPQITKQPVLPAKMEEGQSWSVSVDGNVIPAGYNFPVIVQWQKNAVNIPGANGKTYTIDEVVQGDSGTYRAVLSAPSGKSINSAELVATVIADKVPPTLVLAQSTFASNTKVAVTFSERVSPATANTAANYKINNGITVSAAAVTSNPRVVELTTSAVPKGSKNQLTVNGVQDKFGNTIAANSTTDIGFQKGVILVTTDPGPLTFPGDNAVNQHLLDRGFDVLLARGSDVPDDGSTALGRDLIVQTSTLGSGTVEIAGVGKFRDLAIPAIEWEASNTDAFGFMEANANPGTTAGQTQVNIVDASHQLAAGLPKGLVTVSGSETYSQAQPVGAHIVATLASDATQAIIFYYDKGEKGFADFVMPARRVFFFFQDNTANVANDNGWKLFDAAVDWSMGVQAAAAQPVLSVSRAGASLTISWTNGGKLQSATSLGSPVSWTDEASGSPATVSPTAAAKFYRVSR